MIDEQGRPEPPWSGSEAETLLGFLDYQRATLLWKASGVDDDGLRRRLDHPSALTLGGIVKHMATVEAFWFLGVVGRLSSDEVWRGDLWGDDLPTDDPEWEWATAADDTGERLLGLWQEAVSRSRAIVARELGSPSALDQTYPAWGGRQHPSLRWVLVHMVEEYARHNGHADLLREQIDGVTGE